MSARRLHGELKHARVEVWITSQARKHTNTVNTVQGHRCSLDADPETNLKLFRTTPVCRMVSGRLQPAVGDMTASPFRLFSFTLIQIRVFGRGGSVRPLWEMDVVKVRTVKVVLPCQTCALS